MSAPVAAGPVPAKETGAARWLTFAPGIRLGGRLRSLAATALLGLFLLAIVFGIRLGSDGRFETMLATIGIAAVSVIGYQVFVGNTGIVSFGHPAFMGLGAYTAGVLTMPLPLKELLLPDLPGWLSGIVTGPIPATLGAGLVAMIVALVIGPVVLRLAGATAGIMTFGLLVIIYDVIRNATSITKGNQTFFGIPRSIDSVAVFAVLAIAMLAAVAFKFSAAGLRARAVREDELAARAAGIPVVSARLWPWVISAFISGVAGGLVAQNLTAFSPNSFYIAAVIPMLLMSVLGGLGSVTGALVGAVLISAWLELLRNFDTLAVGSMEWSIPPSLANLTLGLGLLLLLRLRPEGLLGDLELIWSTRSNDQKTNEAQ